MDWTQIAPFVALFSVIVAMWWRLDSKIESRVGGVETRIGGIETRIGHLEALLTDNLIALNRDIGELKGASHTQMTV